MVAKVTDKMDAAGLAWAIYDGVVPNPTITVVKEGLGVCLLYTSRFAPHKVLAAYALIAMALCLISAFAGGHVGLIALTLWCTTRKGSNEFVALLLR